MSTQVATAREQAHRNMEAHVHSGGRIDSFVCSN